MNEANEVAKYIYERLTTNTDVQDIVGRNQVTNQWQVYEGHAPQTASDRFVVFFPQTPEIKRGSGARKIWRKCNYVIKGVCTGDSFQPLEELTNLIDSLFHRDQMDEPHVVIAGTSVVSDIQYTDVEDGIRYNHMGSIVEIMAYGREG